LSYGIFSGFEFKINSLPNSIVLTIEQLYPNLKILTSIILPDSLISLGDFLFISYYCLREVHLSNFLITIDSYVFSY
jgi:hypothetical protein